MSDLSDNESKSKIPGPKIITLKDGNYGRTKWEVLEHEDPEKKDKPELNLTKITKNLEPRKEELNLEGKLGKNITVTRETPKEKQAGFICEICDCIMKDSQTYLDHINGKQHNRMLGMNMKVEKIGVDRVKAKLQGLKQKKEEKVNDFQDFEKRFEDEMKKREENKKKKIITKEINKIIERKLENNEILNEESEDIMKIMGLPGNFTSKKIKK